MFTIEAIKYIETFFELLFFERKILIMVNTEPRHQRFSIPDNNFT